MRIGPHSRTAFQNISRSSSNNPSSSTFQNVLKSQKAPMLQALKEDLQKLSQELKSGKISAEEASKQFVDLVIAKKNEFGLNAKDMKRVQSAVSEIVSQDPLFSIKLEKELKRI